MVRFAKKKFWADGKVLNFKNNYLYDLDLDFFEIKCGADENRFCVEKDNKVGFVDKFGVLKIDYKYKRSMAFFNGICVVGYDYGKKTGAIDKDDNIIIPLKYEDILMINNDLFAAFKNGKCGIIDKNNKVIIDFIFERFGFNFCDGFIGAQYNGKCSFLDEQGKTLKINASDFIDKLDTEEQIKFIFDGEIVK